MWEDEGREYCKSYWCNDIASKENCNPKEVTWAFPFYKTRGLNLCWMLWSSREIKKKITIPRSTLNQWNQNFKRCHSDGSIFRAQVILMCGRDWTLLLHQKGLSPSVITKHFAPKWLWLILFFLLPSVYTAIVLDRCFNNGLWKKTHLGVNSDCSLEGVWHGALMSPYVN